MLQALPAGAAVERAAERGYKNYADAVYRQLHKRYHAPAKRQFPIQYMHGGGLIGTTSFGPRGKRAVHFTPADALAFAGGDKKDRAFAAVMPIHEFAHVFQTNQAADEPVRDYFRNRAAIEGGAEGFTRHMADLYGLPQSTNELYRAYVRGTRRRKGSRYFTKGQFR